MFDLQDSSPETDKGDKYEGFTGLDKLRGVIVSSAKVTSYWEHVFYKRETNEHHWITENYEI